MLTRMVQGTSVFHPPTYSCISQYHDIIVCMFFLPSSSLDGRGKNTYTGCYHDIYALLEWEWRGILLLEITFSDIFRFLITHRMWNLL